MARHEQVRLRCSFFRARMRLVVDFGKMLEIKMGIDLRRADIAMAQQFLDRSEIAAGFE